MIPFDVRTGIYTVKYFQLLITTYAGTLAYKINGKEGCVTKKLSNSREEGKEREKKKDTKLKMRDKQLKNVENDEISV